MSRRSRKTNEVSEMRVKLLVPNLEEGPAESIVRVSAKRAEELFAAKQARRAELSDFTFDRKAA